MTKSRGTWRHSGRLLLATCAAALCFRPSQLSFLVAKAPEGRDVTLRRQLQSAVLVSGEGPAVLRSMRHSLAPLAAAPAEWSLEKEKQVMDSVLGRAPLSLAEELRLARQQTQELVQEIRLLRQSLKAPGAAASSAPVGTPVAQPPAPPAPVSFPTPPSPPAPVTSFPTAAPPVSAPPAAGTGIRVVSGGFGDGNAADFYLNNRKVDIRGQAGRRGMNVMVIDPATQQVTSRKTYDVWADPASENMRLVADLNSLPEGRIVLLAMKDSGLENLDNAVLSALQSFGGTLSPGQLKVREGYALIGTKGGSAIAERQSARVELEGDIPCLVRHPPQLPPEPPQDAMQGQPQFSAPTWAQQAPASAAGGFPPAPAQSSFPTTPPQSSFPTSSFPTAAPSTVSVPKVEVDPQGGVSYNEATVEREGSEEESGQSWQEVVLMLDKLQEKIKAKRLAGV